MNQTEYFISIIKEILKHLLYGEWHVTNNTPPQGCTNFPKSSGRFTFLGADRIVWIKFHTEDLQILGTTVQIYSSLRPGVRDLCTPAT
jgi:hypothetical protein